MSKRPTTGTTCFWSECAKKMVSPINEYMLLSFTEPMGWCIVWKVLTSFLFSRKKSLDMEHSRDKPTRHGDSHCPKRMKRNVPFTANNPKQFKSFASRWWARTFIKGTTVGCVWVVCEDKGIRNDDGCDGWRRLFWLVYIHTYSQLFIFYYNVGSFTTSIAQHNHWHWKNANCPLNTNRTSQMSVD